MRSLFLPILLLLACLSATAQHTRDTSTKLEDIKLTNAPSFSLLDVSPSSIEAPASTKAFVLSIANAINQGSGIPQNYAFEITPFWFFKHRSYTSAKYIGVSKEGENHFARLPFVALSFAIINSDSNTNIGRLANHNASIGVRGNLLRFLNPRTRRRIIVADSQWAEQIKRGMDGEQPTLAGIERLEADNSSWGDTIKSYLQEKPLFALDYAAATNMAFPDNTFGSNHISKTGVWLEANFSFNISRKQTKPENYFNFYTLARYINAKDSMSADKKYYEANMLDFGAKAEFQFNRLFVAYEYISRTNSLTNNNTYKSVGLLQYKIREGLFISGSVGQNFGNVNNLIATLGINWGLSNGMEKVE